VRFFEVASPRRKVVASKRFTRDLKDFVKADPSVGRNLAAFLRFRETAPATQGFGKKDAVFTGNDDLGSFRHVHLIHGKVIVTYQLTPAEIRLCMISDHKETENRTSFPKFLNGLGPGSYDAYADDDENEDEHAQRDRERLHAAVVEALYDFAGHPEDRKMLVQTAKGQFVPLFWEMLRALTEVEGDEAEGNARIVAAMAGINGAAAGLAELKDKIAQVLAHTG
jgi:mRNA-degrading endonuclease YafQ of YafQ-DinJ toxin-antitoxin module